MKGTVTLIVPCYNEEESLPIFYHAVCDVAQTLPDYQMTFLLINDGSKDNTLQIMRDLAAKDERVKYLSFSRNFGKEAASMRAFVMRRETTLPLWMRICRIRRPCCLK